jgi:hypothetical protein
MKYPRIIILVLAAAMSTGALAQGDHDDDAATPALASLFSDPNA